jgi:predicted transcriptional regulator of viral defense system
MKTRNTILSGRDASLIEDIVVNFGRIVSFDQIKKGLAKNYSAVGIKKRISFLTKQGWFVRIKKGLYIVVTDIGGLGSNDVSSNAISRALNNESYVSFENALQYHGMFDQMVSGTSAVTFERARTYRVKDMTIKFFKIKKELYFGFTEERSDIGLVNIAQKEKALLDILYFRATRYHASLVWEKLKDHRDRIDFKVLKQYAAKFNFNVIRQVGVFLDQIGIDTKDIHSVVAGKKSYSKMTKESKHFNAKWRLYYDDSIVG